MPESGLFDFVEFFTQLAPKLIKRVSKSIRQLPRSSFLALQTARDKAIADAICHLEDDVLVKERKRPDLAPLLAESQAEYSAATLTESSKMSVQDPKSATAHDLSCSDSSQHASESKKCENPEDEELKDSSSVAAKLSGEKSAAKPAPSKRQQSVSKSNIKPKTARSKYKSGKI